MSQIIMISIEIVPESSSIREEIESFLKKKHDTTEDINVLYFTVEDEELSDEFNFIVKDLQGIEILNFTLTCKNAKTLGQFLVNRSE